MLLWYPYQFFKLPTKYFAFQKYIYFLDYATTIVSMFPPLPPLHTAPSQAISTPLFMSMVICISSLAAFFLYCTLCPHGYSVTTNLYFLTLHLFTNSPRTSSTLAAIRNVLCIYVFVSVLLCLVCFLDSNVDRYVFIAILLFIVLIIFF